MKYSLDVIMSDAEGSLERLLGKLRQRGFAMCAMSAGKTHDQAGLHARITIESARPVEPLVKHLSKLFDVRYVAVSSMEANLAHVQTQVSADEQLGLCASL